MRSAVALFVGALVGFLLAASAYAQSRELGRAYLKDGQLKRALDAYELAISIAPYDEQLYLDIVEVYLEAGFADEADAALSRAARVFPNSRLPRYNQLNYRLAELYANAARVGKALEGFERAARVKGPVALDLIYKRIGDMQTDLLRFREALSAYTKALEMNPHHAGARLALANLYLRRNMLDDALAEFIRVIRASPRNVTALYGLAEVHSRSGRFQDSVRAAERALKLEPKHVLSHYIRGRALLRLGRHKEGEKALQAYRELEAMWRMADQRLRELHAFSSGGAALLLQGQFEEAIDLLREGIAKYPDAATLYFNLGLAQSEAGRHREAVQTFQTLIQRGLGDGSRIHENLAREYAILGEIRASERHRAIYLQMREAEFKQK
jgi:tetratricopeptide (TPR) repeat protein